MSSKSQPELTCNRRTSLNSGRNLTEAVVSLCDSCKLDSAQAMTVNLRILTGSSPDHLVHGRFFPHGAHGSLPGKDMSRGVWRLVGFHSSSRSCKANMCFLMSVPFIFRNRYCNRDLSCLNKVLCNPKQQ